MDLAISEVGNPHIQGKGAEQEFSDLYEFCKHKMEHKMKYIINI